MSGTTVTYAVPLVIFISFPFDIFWGVKAVSMKATPPKNQHDNKPDSLCRATFTLRHGIFNK